MSEKFKINIYFDEKGEKLEKIISELLIQKIEKVKVQNLNLQM